VVRKSNNRSRSTGDEHRAPGRLSRRRDARRDAILRAAAGMFRERGFAETGMRDIAEAADLSAANLYHYFGSKDEILYYCQDRALDRMLASLRTARREQVSSAEKVGLVIRAHLATMLDVVEGASAHLQVEALSPPLRTKIVRKRDQYERGLRKLIDEGIARKEIVASDSAVVARAILGALNWSVTWFRPDGQQSAAVVADHIAGFLVRGLSTNGDVGRPEGRPLRRDP
jgi:AcrR family transcriptional regulator